MSDFYVETLEKLLRSNVLRCDMQILAVCAGDYDKEALLQCHFTNVVISNLDRRLNGTEFAPYQWKHADAEALEYRDNTFDFAIAHSGLHHCQSPHRALLEMYRVSRFGLLVFEPLDNAPSRLGIRLGLGQEYEIAAVAGNDYAYGGLKNTPIPNYVYRWTEREVEKTIHAYAPTGEHEFVYFYKFRMPWERSQLVNHRMLNLAFKAISPFARMFTLLFPRYSNNFAFVVRKPQLPGGLHPWLTKQNGQIELNKSWVKARYH